MTRIAKSPFFQETEDGYFLVRPYGELGGVYRVEPEIKERFVRFRRLSGLPYVCVFLVFVFQLVPLSLALSFLLLWCLIDVGVRINMMRKAQRVAKDSWKKPDSKQFGFLFPKWMLGVFIPILCFVGFLSSKALYLVLVRAEAIGREEQSAVIILLLLVCAAIFLLFLCVRGILRKRR